MGSERPTTDIDRTKFGARNLTFEWSGSEGQFPKQK